MRRDSTLVAVSQPTVPDVVAAAARLLGRPLALVRELTGGQHARTLLADDGAAHVVVRVFPRADDAVARELAVLARLGPLGRLAPAALAHGDLDGHGVIVTEAVPGGPPSPTLDPVVIGEQLGVALAAVHRLDPSGLPDDVREPTLRAGRLAASAQEAWREADLDRVLTHGDYWSGNTVWEGDRLAGVVDWSGGRRRAGSTSPGAGRTSSCSGPPTRPTGSSRPTRARSGAGCSTCTPGTWSPPPGRTRTSRRGRRTTPGSDGPRSTRGCSARASTRLDAWLGSLIGPRTTG